MGPTADVRACGWVGCDRNSAIEVWTKPLGHGRTAAFIVNTADEPKTDAAADDSAEIDQQVRFARAFQPLLTRGRVRAPPAGFACFWAFPLPVGRSHQQAAHKIKCAEDAPYDLTQCSDAIGTLGATTCLIRHSAFILPSNWFWVVFFPLQGVSSGNPEMTLAPCDPGRPSQLWKLSPNGDPTNVQVATPKGGCWEITGCSTGQNANVGTGYGCKSLPKHVDQCASTPCMCNGAWTVNKANSTITSAMDNHCLQVTPPDGTRLVRPF